MATLDLKVQYVADEKGDVKSVILPLALWQEITSERETAHLLKSAAMKKRLLAARKRARGISLKEARAQFGI